MRVLATLLALALAACTNTPPIAVRPTPTPTREPDTVSVTALLDLSGPRAPSGQAQRDAMQLWLDATPSATRAVRLRLKVVDVGGSDARALIELRRAVTDDRADAIVVGTPAAFDETFSRAAEAAGVPVLLTLPAPEPVATSGGRWLFALAPRPDEIARLLVDDIDARRVRLPTLLVSDETPTAVAERVAFTVETERLGHAAPAPVVVTAGDAAQRIGGPVAVAKSVVFAGATAKYADAVRSIAVGPGAPRVYLSYLTETADLGALHEQAVLVTWPGSRHLATLSATPPSATASSATGRASTAPSATTPSATAASATTLPSARAAFIRAFGQRHGAPSTLAATAYDALGLIDAATALTPGRLGGADLRGRIEDLTFPGVATRYAFTPARHAGFDNADLAYLRWDASRSAPLLAEHAVEAAK